VSYTDAVSAADQAFRTWIDADCGGGARPGIRTMNLGPVACNRREQRTGAGSANIIMFRDGPWPHENANVTIALTTVSFEEDTGEIVDVDIEVNAHDWQLTVSPSTGGTDLVAALTHEVGHFFGLAHSNVPDATMGPDYSSDMRQLKDDDVQGFCFVYRPFQSEPASCNPIPEDGFSPLCASDQRAPTCTASAIDHRGDGPGAKELVGVGAILVVGWARRRRRKPEITAHSARQVPA
jgi:hypothetical protein